ncbi:uncharacterized protein LOC141907753 [Tubulanus polymorphus]|uniref:uncharacterized protein LOC141907753 n=1 Tax=Tubulanus polymorphus TaxID=672921 RepID=UPI003DA65537
MDAHIHRQHFGQRFHQRLARQPPPQDQLTFQKALEPPPPHRGEIIWESTLLLGCAMNKCHGKTITVCNYSPAGNLPSLIKTPYSIAKPSKNPEVATTTPTPTCNTEGETRVLQWTIKQRTGRTIVRTLGQICRSAVFVNSYKKKEIAFNLYPRNDSVSNNCSKVEPAACGHYLHWTKQESAIYHMQDYVCQHPADMDCNAYCRKCLATKCEKFDGTYIEIGGEWQYVHLDKQSNSTWTIICTLVGNQILKEVSFEIF